MTDSAANPACSAARATPRSQPRGSVPHGKAETCRPNRRLGRAGSADVAVGDAAGTGVVPVSTVLIASKPSELSSISAVRRCWARSAGAGTGRSRVRLRARQTSRAVVKTTATHASPAARARSTTDRRRGPSSPRVSTTVVNPRRRRAATTASSTANASTEASRSASPLPTIARNASAETTSFAAKCVRAQVVLPDPAGPMSTTNVGRGRSIIVRPRCARAVRCGAAPACPGRSRWMRGRRQDRAPRRRSPAADRRCPGTPPAPADPPRR